MESPPASAAVDPLQPPADDSASAAAWDWGNFFDFSIVDDDSLILPWSIPDEAQTPPPLATAELPPVPLPSPPAPAPLDGSGRVRKRDPRLVCPNYLAGRVPCSCPEMDEKALEEEEVTEVVTAARKRTRTGGASAVVRCQVPGCEADISELKGYHKRHRVCLRCANASSVVLDEEHKRYCQQCGKFHILPDFDEGKRSCRRKLERHNKRRRRKPNDGNNILEKEMEAQGDSPLDVTCDGEPMKETPNEFTCNTVETVVSNKVLDGDTPVDSEDGQGSPIGSLPSLKNDELAASAEVQKDERISNSKSSLSTTSCDNKSTYSPMCPTGRISFKLYDWNPAEFPRRLRHQIFQWLANMPVELEGYIRPGCTILTIFIAMPQFMWDKLSQDVAHYVRDLINTPGSLLLGRGTILIYLSNTIIHVLPDGTTLTNIKMEVQAPRLHYVCPSYFEAGKPMEFVVCGSHLKQPKFRFLISFDGKYLKHNSVCAIPIDKKSMHYDGNEAEHIDDEHEMLRIKVTHMNLEVSGPAFIEVENVSGISNFIPVLVGNKETCSELERMEEVLYGSSYASSFMSQNVITDFSPGMCGILSSRQYGMSSLLLDIAWLLKTPTPEEKEVFWNSINLQRITHLLKFLIESELSGVLQMVMHHLDNIILIKGSEKSDNGISDVDQNLFHEYFNHARKVLYQRMGHVMGSEVEQRSATSGSLMSQSSGRTNMGDKSCANQDDEVIGESLLSTSWQPASEQDVKVPLVTREIIYKQSCSQNLGIKYFFGDIFSNKIMRTRFPLFVVVSVVLCFAACIILLHPHKAGEFAVSIRRCMFGGSPT
ncbi:squamosa promoter-binding-like protein 9 [Canna indica]|uniref:Squamosa promoter-binding-like protein 9 n=1 Tax=Canna indica TaxID=4628 RepID=A0AAQ3JTV8_9LILI|nr:squamosa promoter-binding-like protein 9 [Canna indica]